MSGFGPFAGEEEIDFEKEELCGIFLITGDTGSGKTTIFDAISFALYGEASGEWRTSDCFRSGYADAQTKTFVELTFLQKGKRYRIRRNPEYRRPSRRGEGWTNEKKDAELYFPDGSVVGGFVKVSEAAEKIVGMNRRQFKQTAMIAQGEFLKLLTADSKERGEIFRKVFDTEPYQIFQKKLAEKEREYGERCKEQERRRIRLLEEVEREAEFGEMESLAKAAGEQNRQEIGTLLGRLVEWERIRQEQQEAALEKTEEELSRQKEELGSAREREKIFQALEEREERQRELEKEKDEEEARRERLRAACRASEKVVPAERGWINADSEARQSKEQMIQLEKQLEEAQEKAETWRKKEETHREKEEEIEEAREKIRRLEEELPIRQKKRNLEQELERLQEERENAEKERKKIQRQYEDGKQEQEELKKWAEEHAGDEEQARTCRSRREEAQRQQQEVWNLWKEKKEVDKLSRQEEKRKKDYCDHKAAWEETNRAFSQTERQFFGNLAGILAEQLEEGAPCPVCGSVDHPNKAQKMETAVSEEVWRQRREETDRCRDELYQKKQEFEKKQQERKSKEESLQERLEKLRREIEERVEPESEEKRQEDIKEQTSLEILNGMDARLQSFLKAVKEQEQKWNGLLGEKEKKQERMDRICKELEVLQHKISAAQAREREHEGKIQKCRGKIEGLEEKLPQGCKEDTELDLEKLKKSVEAFEREAEEIEKKKKEAQEENSRQRGRCEMQHEACAKKQQRAEECREEWERRRIEAGFLTEQSYRDALLTEKEIKELKDDLEARSRERQALREKIEEDKRRLDGRQREDLEERQRQIARAEQEKKELETAHRELSDRARRNREIYRKLLELEEEQKQEKDLYIRYKELSDTANGRITGKEKLAFEQYVQSFYFRQVVQKANQRFCRMSGGQYELRCMEQAQDRQKSAGLDLEIMDYYIGRTRSVKSLSGGEAFQAALALSLGFSDVVQSYAGGIEVDAVFLDEGFGSLDSNALECAVQVLAQLSGENRMVGIISHVAELKERIEKKVELSRTAHGSRITVKR